MSDEKQYVPVGTVNTRHRDGQRGFVRVLRDAASGSVRLQASRGLADMTIDMPPALARSVLDLLVKAVAGGPVQ